MTTWIFILYCKYGFYDTELINNIFGYAGNFVVNTIINNIYFFLYKKISIWLYFFLFMVNKLFIMDLGLEDIWGFYTINIYIIFIIFILGYIFFNNIFFIKFNNIKFCF